MKSRSSLSFQLDFLRRGTSYMDGVFHVHIVGCLFELWGLSSFDRGWIECHRDVRRNFTVLTRKISLASKLHGESQQESLQLCLSQEKQHSIIRTIFATGITGRCE